MRMYGREARVNDAWEQNVVSWYVERLLRTTSIRYSTWCGVPIEAYSSTKGATMKRIEKTIKPRLPKEVAEKLRHANGGGRHTDKKADYKRRPKHRNKEES